MGISREDREKLHTFKLDVFFDGDNEDESEVLPETILVQFSDKDIDSLIKTQAMLVSTGAKSISITLPDVNLEFFDKDGGVHAGIQMIHFPSIVIDEKSLYFRMKMKRGHDYMVSEDVNFNANKKLDVDDPHRVRLITNALGVFATASTISSINKSFDSITKEQGYVTMNDADKLTSSIQNIPKIYRDAANELNVNLLSNAKDSLSVVFMELVKINNNGAVTERNITNVIKEAVYNIESNNIDMREALDQAICKYSNVKESTAASTFKI